MPDKSTARSKTPVLTRILRRVDSSDPAKCWVWPGSTNDGGYGVVATADHRCALVHRVVWEKVAGQSIPDGHEIHHRCENRLCVNPDHLEPLTRLEHRAQHPSYQLTKTHCPQGHPYNEENTYHYPDGRRRCRRCGREQMRRRRART